MPKRRPRYFIYRKEPFRPCYHEHYFQEPRLLKEATRRAVHIWWFTDLGLVQRMIKQFSKYQPTYWAEERDYACLSRGDDPYPPKQKPQKASANHTRTEKVDDL